MLLMLLKQVVGRRSDFKVSNLPIFRSNHSHRSPIMGSKYPTRGPNTSLNW